MNEKEVIAQLILKCESGAPNVVSEEKLGQKEAELGFQLPALLRNYYLKVSNGKVAGIYPIEELVNGYKELVELEEPDVPKWPDNW